MIRTFNPFKFLFDIDAVECMLNTKAAYFHTNHHIMTIKGSSEQMYIIAAGE